MKKRFNIVVINSDRIDGFLNNFEKKLRISIEELILLHYLMHQKKMKIQ